MVKMTKMVKNGKNDSKMVKNGKNYDNGQIWQKL